MQEGVYLLKKGIPATCLEGFVELREVDGQVSLLIIESSLLTNLTLADNEVSYKNGGCQHLIVNHREGSKISGTHTRTCGKDITVFRRKVSITPTTVTYSVIGEFNGKVTTNVTCALEKRK